MAKKPAAAHTADDIPPAMDYAQHQGTYRGFLQLTKYGIIAMAILVVALYCFIEAGQPVLGWLLVFAIPAVVIAQIVTRSRR
jgi:hypothetical protein